MTNQTTSQAFEKLLNDHAIHEEIYTPPSMLEAYELGKKEGREEQKKKDCQIAHEHSAVNVEADIYSQ